MDTKKIVSLNGGSKNTRLRKSKKNTYKKSKLRKSKTSIKKNIKKLSKRHMNGGARKVRHVSKRSSKLKKTTKKTSKKTKRYNKLKGGNPNPVLPGVMTKPVLRASPPTEEAKRAASIANIREATPALIQAGIDKAKAKVQPELIYVEPFPKKN